MPSDLPHMRAVSKFFKGTYRETRLRKAPAEEVRTLRRFAREMFDCDMGKVRLFIALDWAFEGNNSLWGCCVRQNDGSNCVVIHKRLLNLPRILSWVMLHELAHIPNQEKDAHGPKFKREMRRLVRQRVFDNIL